VRREGLNFARALRERWDGQIETVRSGRRKDRKWLN